MPKRPSKAPRPALRLGAMSTLVGFQIRMAQLRIYDDFMRRAPVRRLTPGQLAILVLIDQNAALTQQQLSDGIRVEKSTLAVRLNRLVARGLIRRVRSPNDGRENIVQLTASGKRKLAEMMRFTIEHERRLTTRLSAAELQQLLQLLARIR